MRVLGSTATAEGKPVLGSRTILGTILISLALINRGWFSRLL